MLCLILSNELLNVLYFEVEISLNWEPKLLVFWFRVFDNISTFSSNSDELLTSVSGLESFVNSFKVSALN